MSDPSAEVWSQAGYNPASQKDCAILDQVLGQQWRQWLVDCAASGEAAENYEALRSAMHGISAVLHGVLAGMGLWLSARQRLDLAMRTGRSLRAAIATLLKDGVTESKRQSALRFIREAAQGNGQGPDNKRVHHIYASTNAATFEFTTGKDGQAVLQVEAAQKGQGGGYDWSRKIILQLKESETMQVLAVLRGWLDRLEVSNHGTARDKRLTLKRQEHGAGFLLNVRQGGEARAVPIPPFECHRIIAMALQVLQTNNPALTTDMIAEMARDLSCHQAR